MVNRIQTIPLLFVALVGCAVYAGSQNAAPPSLQQLFQELVQQHSSGHPPTYDDVLRVAHRAEETTPKDVTDAMPLIMAALQSPDIDLHTDAALVIWGVGSRVDALELLRGQYQALAQLLLSPDERLQMTPIFLFNELRPKAPPEVIPILLQFLGRPNRDAKAQAGAVGILVRIAPQDPQVIASIRAYLSKPQDTSSRINTLNALRGMKTSDDELIAAVITSLGDSDPGVRFTAVQVIPTMGPNALRQAEPALRKMIANAEEAPGTQATAKQALEQVGSH